MNKIVLHIPHSSLKLPKEFLNNEFLLSIDDINKFNIEVCDLFIDKLFPLKKYKTIKFNYSRIFCDVEKYANDEQEPMSKFGMGVIYTKTNKGQIFFSYNNEYKEQLIKKFYFPHHACLETTVNGLLEKNNTILIDCHSFGKDIVMGDVDKNKLPDICIGVNQDFSFNKELTSYVIQYFQNLGYSVKTNFPYSGTIIPNNLKQSNNSFYSIMIEINKKIYLENNKPNNNFKKLQEQISNLLKQLENKNI